MQHCNTVPTLGQELCRTCVYAEVKVKYQPSLIKGHQVSVGTNRTFFLCFLHQIQSKAFLFTEQVRTLISLVPWELAVQIRQY